MKIVLPHYQEYLELMIQIETAVPRSGFPTTSLNTDRPVLEQSHSLVFFAVGSLWSLVRYYNRYSLLDLKQHRISIIGHVLEYQSILSFAKRLSILLISL